MFNLTSYWKVEALLLLAVEILTRPPMNKKKPHSARSFSVSYEGTTSSGTWDPTVEALGYGGFTIGRFTHSRKEMAHTEVHMCINGQSKGT